jgi:hypothetical protein
MLTLTWLGLVLHWWGVVGTSLLFNAIVTALTAVVVLAYLQELGFSRRTALIVALAFGLTTLAWPYANSTSTRFPPALLGTAFALLKFNRGRGERGAGRKDFFSPSTLILYRRDFVWLNVH